MENLLTNKQLEAMARTVATKALNDGGGLRAKPRERGGTTVYAFEYRYRGNDGKGRSISCGIWPEQSLAEIRKRRNEIRVAVGRGEDPVESQRADKAKARIASSVEVEREKLAAAEEIRRLEEERIRVEEEAARAAARQTVRQLFAHWKLVDLSRRKDKGAEVLRMFEKDVFPTLGNVAIEDVKKGHVTQVLDVILARGANRMAKQILSLVRQMFRFAVDRDLVTADPTAAIRKYKIGGKDGERDRALSEQEIRSLAEKLENSDLTIKCRLAVWLLLATCARVGELCAAQWKNIDFEARTWLIPNPKNGHDHLVYLSEFALENFAALRAIQLQELGPDASNAELPLWVLPNRHETGPLDPKTITKQLTDRQRGSPPMSGRSEMTDVLILPNGKFGAHDLRRTGATLMVSLGALPEVAERCLNHVEPNRLKRIYQRYGYRDEMRAAWENLGKRLELLTRSTGDNVVVIPSNRAAA